MTLETLFKRVDFKEIAPLIVQLYPDMGGSLAHFKQAFDILRHLKPQADADDADENMEISKCYDDEDDGGKFYYCVEPGCGVASWESCLAKEVVLKDEITLSDNEIAVHCLWELTFYGFDAGWTAFLDRIEGKTDASNPYTVAAEKLENKMRSNYLPKQFRDAVAGTTYVSSEEWLKERKAMGEKRWKDYHSAKYLPMDVKERTRRNRAKRMRDYRQELRIKKLERMAKVENVIRDLIADTQSFTREALGYLFDTKLITNDSYQSHSQDVSQRMDYLIDLFSNYVTDDYSQFTHFVLMFRTSSDYPLVQGELDRIVDFFRQYLPLSADIRCGYGNDEILDVEVGLFFLGYY